MDKLLSALDKADIARRDDVRTSMLSLSHTLDDGLTAAVEAFSAVEADAFAWAATIAAAAGARLGRIDAASEGSGMDVPVPFKAARMALKARAASTPVEARTREISVALSATFEITGQ